MKKYKVIDLFAGAGGFSEGFLQTGAFEFLAHVEWEKPMVDTLRSNLINRWGYSAKKAKQTVVRFDIQKTEELLHGNWSNDTVKTYGKDNSNIIVQKGLDGIIKNETVDIVIGGPPCQAYSIAGRAQDINSMRSDYRNYLFESFVKIVDYYKPQIFVFENVPGILSAIPKGKFIIELIYEAFDSIGYKIRQPNLMNKSLYSSADFQVPQERRRAIIIGVKKDSAYSVEDFYSSLDNHKSSAPKRTIWDSIYQMPKFKPLDKPYKKEGKNISHELVGESKISRHEARYHNKRDIEVFKLWINNSMNNAPNKQKIEFYTQITGKATNHNKYRSLEWNKPSPTIVSHLYKDGLMFIHPDLEQVRTITVREAAILQTFPMDFEFIGSNAYCFKMIGNAVPILFAKSIALSVANVLEKKQ